MGALTEYPAVSRPEKDDIFIIDGVKGTRKIPMSDTAIELAGMISPINHRNIWRGKCLGNAVTAAQKAAIATSTFDDIFIGDYWTISGIDWVVSDMDYFYQTGDTNITKHHLVIVPRLGWYTHVMNDAHVTTGGYANSKMRASGLNEAKAKFTAAFGDMIITHRELFTNAVTNGKPSGGAWMDATVELMNEIMVYGTTVFTPACDGTTVPYLYTTNKVQLAAFRLNPAFITVRGQWYFLRDVVSSAYFASVSAIGDAHAYGAAHAGYVRPYAIIG
nr:MAG TPA: hypothetical protein [Caudoviricetes sp.]